MSPNDLKGVEDALKSLIPSAPEINRDRLMYEAGRASARVARGWKAATAVLSVLVVGLSAAWVLRDLPGPNGPLVVYVRVPEAPPAPQPELIAETPDVAPEQPEPVYPVSTREAPLPRYRKVQENVLRWGIYGLPVPPAIPKADEARSLDAMLDSL